jgi:hypothetical protein
MTLQVPAETYSGQEYLHVICDIAPFSGKLSRNQSAERDGKTWRPKSQLP